MSDRDGKYRTCTPVQVRQAEVDLAKRGVDGSTVFHPGNDGGREMVRKRITRDGLYIADAAACTEAAAAVVFIRKAEGPQIGAQRRDLPTPKIQTALFDTVKGRNSTYAHGLTRV